MKLPEKFLLLLEVSQQDILMSSEGKLAVGKG